MYVATGVTYVAIPYPIARYTFHHDTIAVHAHLLTFQVGISVKVSQTAILVVCSQLNHVSVLRWSFNNYPHLPWTNKQPSVSYKATDWQLAIELTSQLATLCDSYIVAINIDFSLLSPFDHVHVYLIEYQPLTLQSSPKFVTKFRLFQGIKVTK